MRLLLVPDPTSPNGEDAFCREIAKRAQERGHWTRIETVPNGPLQATLDRLQAAGFSLEAEAVVINSLQPAALLAAKAAGRRAVVRLVDSYASASAEALAEVKRLALQADLILVPSRYLADIVGAWGLNGSARMVPYAYDRIMAQQIAIVTMQTLRPTGFQLVAAASLNETTRPGLETLLFTVSRLRLDCHVSVIGEGPALAALKERASQLSAQDKATFLGALPHAKIMEHFRAARAFVDPCGIEGFPTLALHALSEGCPVIAARAGALPEFIRDGENGLLFSPGDALGLSEAIVTLASEPGLSLRLIREGIRTVEAHTWDATVNALFSALETPK